MLGTSVETRVCVPVSMVLGIPTVKREVQSYLLATLQNLIDSMNDQEAADSLIVVFIAEVCHAFCTVMFNLWTHALSVCTSILCLSSSYPLKGYSHQSVRPFIKFFTFYPLVRFRCVLV